MRILITGASGAGSSTLAAALSSQMQYAYLDSDNYYWVKPEPPFLDKRSPEERFKLLETDLKNHPNCILAGGINNWGISIEDSFDLIVFLYLDSPIRIERLRHREINRFGFADEEFLLWASQYDEGPPEGRSLAKHRAWLSKRKCPILELSGDLTVKQRLEQVLEKIPSND